MPPNKRGRKSSKSQDIKSLENEIKSLRKEARSLLAKANKNRKEFEKEISSLKKAGVISNKLKPRNIRVTPYRLRQIKRFQDIISGEAIAVAAPKDIREQYASKGLYEKRGRFLIVPKEEASEKAKIERGMISITRKLKNGEWRRIILPFKASDLEDVATRLRNDPSLDKLKEADEQFGFRLFGHNGAQGMGFVTADELASYILERYTHLFKGKDRKEGLKHFELFRFKHYAMPEAPEENKVYNKGKMDKKGRTSDRHRNDTFYKQRLERDAARKRKLRANETEEEKNARLEKQREYDRSKVNDRRAKRIERKMGLK